MNSAAAISSCPLSEKNLDAIIGRYPGPKRGERLIRTRDAIRLNWFPTEWESHLTEASQKNYRRYKPARVIGTANVINDCFERADFAGRRVLELGPGHYTFAIIARSLGAELVCVEKDPVLADFGRRLGFDVLFTNFLQSNFAVTMTEREGCFDGLWLRGVLNACKFADVRDLAQYIEQLSLIIDKRGWGHATTCNSAARLSAEMDRDLFEDRRIEAQRRAFTDCKWSAYPIDDVTRQRYRLNFAGSRYMFTRGLADPLAFA